MKEELEKYIEQLAKARDDYYKRYALNVIPSTKQYWLGMKDSVEATINDLNKIIKKEA